MGSFVSHLGNAQPGDNGIHPTRRHVLALAALGLSVGVPGATVAAGPEGQLTWGVHISLAPTWFDPAETPGVITPFMVFYALHDAHVAEQGLARGSACGSASSRSRTGRAPAGAL